MNAFSCALAATALSCLAGTGLAQPAPASQAEPGTAPPAARAELVLRAGTEVPMTTRSELSSKRNRQGDRFELEVSDDVRVDGIVVIPRGSRGVGEITRLVRKGAFGKSGKLETQLLYVTVGHHQIRLDGRSGDRGKSGTAGTVVAVATVWVVAPFITGTSARVPAGSTMVGYVETDLPVVVERAKPAPLVIQTPATEPAPAGSSPDPSG